MVQLVRVEHPSDGYGMWRTDNSISKIYGLDDLLERHSAYTDGMPTPQQENLGMTGKHFCAYNSIEQIQQWVKPDEFKILFENGFIVLLLEVSECQTGEAQYIPCENAMKVLCDRIYK